MSQLDILAITSLAVAIVCFLIIITDILTGNKQDMMIMNFVYPITSLYAGPFALLVYFTLGRRSGKKPFWQSVVASTLHCGSGCTLGDLAGETFLLIVPVTLFGMKLYGSWAVEFALAFSLGILFQYLAIKPMKDLSLGQCIKAALKADALSLVFWQIGMYGWMAIVTFSIYHRELSAKTPLFWFMMQIGMIFGFLIAYPVNWWLLKVKIKEPM
jgi:hypothetical protein